MPEQITKIEKQDIVAPPIQPGGTAIVLQRHERYQRDRSADNAGSLLPGAIESTAQLSLEFFRDVIAQDADGAETMVLFVSSDTQYAGKGRRSLETAQLAQDAAIEAFKETGIDPASRIINLNENFRTKGHGASHPNIRPMRQIVEPKIFDTPKYVDHLREKYGAEDGPGTGISSRAWAAHEMDTEKEIRKQLDAEGVHDMLDRAKVGISMLKKYAEAFHETNPGKRLVIWANSHYDTISPLVKDTTGASFSEHVPVDYGAGVVIDIEPGSGNMELAAQSRRVAFTLGREAVNASQQ